MDQLDKVYFSAQCLSLRQQAKICWCFLRYRLLSLVSASRIVSVSLARLALQMTPQIADQLRCRHNSGDAPYRRTRLQRSRNQQDSARRIKSMEKMCAEAVRSLLPTTWTLFDKHSWHLFRAQMTLCSFTYSCDKRESSQLCSEQWVSGYNLL
jgi:hypothetical protein